MRDRNEFSKATTMFSGSSNPMKSTGMLYDQTGCGKSKMAASNIWDMCTGSTHIYACRHNRRTNLKAISMFFRSSYPIEQSRVIYDLTGNRKSKTAASKLQIRISQLVHKITTKFKRLYLCFLGPAIQWDRWKCCTTKREETGSGKSKMVASNPEVLIAQPVDMIGT